MSTARKFEAAVQKWLQEERGRRSADVLQGVPVEVYRERIAYIQALSDVAAELPVILKTLDD